MSCSGGVKGKIDRIVGKPRGKGRLPTAKARPDIGKSVGTGWPGGGEGTGNTSFPLKETRSKDRTYHDPEIIFSTDGMFSLTIQRLKLLKTKDDKGGDADIEFAS